MNRENNILLGLVIAALSFIVLMLTVLPAHGASLPEFPFKTVADVQAHDPELGPVFSCGMSKPAQALRVLIGKDAWVIYASEHYDLFLLYIGNKDGAEPDAVYVVRSDGKGNIKIVSSFPFAEAKSKAPGGPCDLMYPQEAKSL